MALTRARGPHDHPLAVLVMLAAVGWVCALLAVRIDRLRSDVCRSIEGIEGGLMTRVDELCTAAHTLGAAAEAARAAGAPARPPDLAAEAAEAERVADAEERGERAPAPGHRRRRAAS